MQKAANTQNDKKLINPSLHNFFNFEKKNTFLDS